MELSASTLVLAGLITALLWLLSLKSRRQLCLPPGPSGLPVIGNLPQLDKSAPFKTLLKEALVDQGDDFTGRVPLPFLIRITKGYGLAISNGERWQQLRRFTLTTLRDFGMGRKGMEKWIQEESKHLVARINSTNATPFDPTYFLGCTVSNVICCMVFGQRFSYDDDHFLYLLQTISELLKFVSSPWGQVYNIFPRLMEWVPGRQHKVFARTEEVREFYHEKDPRT